MTSGARASQYSKAVREVIARGSWEPTSQGPQALTAMQVILKYQVASGFPMITERSIASFWRKPVGELFAFINGAHTARSLRRFGCDWWDPWAESFSGASARPEASLGQGSYGVAFHDFPMGVDRFDQFDGLVDRIVNGHMDRTHVITPWIPFRQWEGYGEGRLVAVSPCHGWLHFRVLNGSLCLHSYHRAADMLIGLPSNLVQYGALMLAVCRLTDLTPGVLYVTISDAHIYRDQMSFAEELVSRPSLPLPTVVLNRDAHAVSSLREFRAHHFDLRGYRSHPAMPGIPVSGRPC